MDRSVEDTIIRGGNFYYLLLSGGTLSVGGGGLGGLKKIKLIEGNPKI
jgi:hypothetical protein